MELIEDTMINMRIIMIINLPSINFKIVGKRLNVHVISSISFMLILATNLECFEYTSIMAMLPTMENRKLYNII